jgi:hypothetical protein
MNMKMRFCTALLTAATLLAPLSLLAETAQDAVAKRHAIETYGKLPLSFEPGESAAHFLARSGNYTVSVGERESSVVVTDAKSGRHQTLRFTFDNANPAVRLEALEPQPGVTNYYLGKNASQWRLGVKSYGKLRAQSVYPGVDVVYYGDHRQLEFDFVVAPKADPSAIALSFSGMDKLYKDASGNLVIEVGGQPVRFAKPYAYQKAGGDSKAVLADYELTADGKVHLHLGDYDRNAELIIDPIVTYVSYLGGSGGDVGNGIAVDKSGAAYVTGQTCSSNFPVSEASGNLYNYDIAANPGSCDAYVTEFSADGPTTTYGSAFVYTTIIGGTSPSNATAVGNAIAVDSTGQAYITGMTNFTDLPGLPSGPSYTNNLNSWNGGDSDAFIAILSSDAGGAQPGLLVRTSYLGGTNSDTGNGIAVDTVSPAFNGPNVTVVGQTCSYDFPAYNAFETMVEPCVGFITKLDNGLHIATPTYGNIPRDPLIVAMAPPTAAPVGATYFFSEFFGGQPVAPILNSVWQQNTTYPPGAIIQDSNSPIPNIEITFNGGRSGASEPAWQTTALTITPDGTYPKGVNWENLGPVALIPTHDTWAYGVALDPLGDIFVAGGTTTPNVVSGVWPFERFLNSGTGAWVIKVNGQQSPVTGQSVGQPGAWVYGSALEGTPTTSATIDAARAIAVDNSGEAFVTGTMTGTLLGTSSSSYKSKVTGGQDAFLVKLNNAGDAFPYATYLGGDGADQGLGVAVDGSGAAYVTGSTQSTDFPTINPLTYPNGTALLTLSGGEDAFISKFTTDGTALLFSAYLGGSDLDQSNAIAVDTQNLGNMYVAGNTHSTDLEELNPTTTPLYTAPQPQYGTNGHDGNGDAFVAMVAGSSLATSIVTPGTLNFPLQDVNTTSVPPAATSCLNSGECIQYSNTNGASSITITSITFNNGEFAQFPMSNSSPANCATGVIGPNSACDLWVVFTPAGQGSRSGTVTITDDAGSTPHVVVLSGQGTVPQDALSAPSIAFANQAVSTPSGAKFVTLQNIGSGTLNIAGITIAGVNQGDFSLPNPSPTANPCGTQLAAGSSCTITAIFTPSVAGERTGSIMLTDNSAGSPHTIGLSGTGVPVASTVTPSTLTFPQQAINVPSTALTACLPGAVPGNCVITITNTDTQSLAVTGFSITGDYQLGATNCPVFPLLLAPAAPGSVSSCTVQVVFDPTLPGTRTGTLTVNGNGTVMPYIVGLSGAAGASSTLCGPGAACASPVTFAGTNVGATSPAQFATLTNQSTFAFSVQSVVISGPAAGDFTQTNNCGTSVSGTSALAPAVPYCTISVSFKPTATGNRDATLTVNSNAAGSPQSISILGVGTAPLVSLSPATNLTFPNQPLNAASTQAVITLTNSGSGPLNIPAGGITITGTAASDFSQTNDCGTQVAATGTNYCHIYLVFTPTALFTRSATLNIADDANPSPQSIALLGTGVQVQAPSVAPLTLTFVNQALSQTSPAQSVTISNNDPTYALTLATPAITGDFQIFPANTTCTTSVPKSGSCVISVTFTPTASGSRTGTLTVSTNGAVIPLTVQLSGTGGAVGSVSPTLLNLGSANVNESSAAQSVTVTNSSNFPVNLTGITLSGAAASEFSAVNNCGTVVSPNIPCTVSVTFKPAATGTRTANMTIGSDAATPYALVSLTGTGTSPVVSLSTLSLSFGNQALNVASSALLITLHNTGTGPLNFSSIAITGAAPGDFTETDNCGLQVVSGNSCVLNVTFTPTALNSRTARLVFGDDASNSPQTVALSGSGIAGSGTIALSPATVAFGNQQVSTTSAAQTVTLSNSSPSSALTINNIVITGNSDFAIASGNCPASPAALAANTNCSIRVTFTPSTTVAETATLTVTGTASNSPQQITLTGTGTTAASSSAPFAVTPSTTGVSVTQNGTAQYTLSIAPLNGFSNSINFTCSGPVGSSCSITPNPLVMDGTTTKTATLSVNTTGGNGNTANSRYGGKPIFLALLPFTIMGMLFINKRRSYLLVLALLLLCLLLGTVGCGGGSASSTSSGLAPGTYQVVVTATPSTNSSQAQTMTMNLVVTQQ